MALTYLVIALSMFTAQSAAPAPPPDLTAAKALYTSGDYEEALAKLSAVHDEGSTSEAAEYRALCLLALGRTAEARSVLEELFERAPLFKMSEAEVAPRLVAMFYDVRKRLLPVAVKRIYATARASFEANQFSAAAAQFRTMLAVLGTDGEADEPSELTDLKLLARGFLRLADRELAAEAAAAAAAAAKIEQKPPVESTDKAEASTTPVAPPASESIIYSAADADVTAPVEVSRRMPSWHPPNGVAARREYRGVLRIVVDERGAVEAASLMHPVSESYDSLLLAAVQTWQFKPASKNGAPVRYEKLITISLTPR